MMTNYYEAVKSDGGYRARIYDEVNATVYLSTEVFDTEGEAADAAVDYAEQNNFDVELG